MIRLVWRSSRLGRGIEVGKHQPIGGVGQSRRIARLVVPDLKVRCLGWANTEQDAQHFRMGNPLSQRWIEAGAALFDKPKMETCRVGDGLEVIRDGWGSPRYKALRSSSFLGMAGNCPFSKPGIAGGTCHRGRGFGAAAVPSPITGVHGELHEVGEPSDCWAPVALLLGNVRN